MSKSINLLQAAANVGVLAGIVLVAFQLNQNTELLSAQLIHQESDRYINLESVSMGEDFAEVWAKVLSAPYDLTLKEQISAESYIFSTVERWRSLYRLDQESLLSQEWEPIVREDVTWVLAHDYGRAWWETFSSDPFVTYPREVRDVVDDVLGKTPKDESLRYLGAMMDIVKKPRRSSHVPES